MNTLAGPTIDQELAHVIKRLQWIASFMEKETAREDAEADTTKDDFLRGNGRGRASGFRLGAKFIRDELARVCVCEMEDGDHPACPKHGGAK